MASNGRETKRTSDGFLTVRALRSGEVDVLGWKHKGDVHLVRLTMFRAKPEPPLFQVEHRIVHHPDSDEPWHESHRELFDDVKAARRYFTKLRKQTPETYDIPLEEP